MNFDFELPSEIPPGFKWVPKKEQVKKEVESSFCKKDHPLKLLFDLPSSDYDEGVHCDGYECGKEIDIKDGFYHCSICEEDYCRVCSKQRMEAKKLQEQVDSHDSYRYVSWA
jgi:hypothetical protein